jgi:Hemerythrin HHE cation binding domain
MTVPVDGIRAFHNAFHKDMQAIDAAAYSAARGEAGLDPVVKRYTFFNEVLVWHASGEEEHVFTALEIVAPLVAEAYQRDHRGLDTLFDSLDKAVNASDVLRITRATSAFEFFLNFHLAKEMAHLYRIFEERVAVPDQWVVVGKLAQKIPAERFPEVVNWLFPLVGPEDQENMLRIFQHLMPAPVFAGATQLVKAAIGDDWAELTRRIPELR